MSPLEMGEACLQAMRQPAVCGVILTIPKGKIPKGFPRGELLNEMERNGVIERTYNFNPEKVLVWLEKHLLMDQPNLLADPPAA